MNNTLYTNDVIVVNKLKYGPKLPRSPFEISWLNIAFYFNDNAKKRMNEKWWSYKRLSGYSSIKNGDVLVFNMFNNDMVIVKRCMGIAGDTLSIKNGDVYVNNKPLNPSNLINNVYQFKIKNRDHLYRTLDSLSINIDLNVSKINNFNSTLTIGDKNTLKDMGLIDSIQIVADSVSTRGTLYPHSQNNDWTLDNYGPYIIPKKGITINLTSENYELYNKVINEHEGFIIKNTEGIYTINGKEVRAYTFKQDYYFMMGDHRKGSMDSRYWGLVPVERIIGKVQCVLWSNYLGEFQWNRLFKKVE